MQPENPQNDAGERLVALMHGLDTLWKQSHGNPEICIAAYEKMYLELEHPRKREYPVSYSSLGKLDQPFLPHQVVRLYRRLTGSSK